MASIKEIAERAGVSLNTVSRALNRRNKESWPGVADRAQEIRRIAAEMGYRPNSAARAMRAKASRHVGALMSGAFCSPYEFPVIMGINEVLQPAGYSLSIVDASGIDPRCPEEALAFKEQMLSGIFIMHIPGPVGEYAKSVAPLKIDLDSNVCEPFNCVRRDERHSGYLAAKRLAALGRRELVYVGNRRLENGHRHISDRRDGVLKAAKETGVEILELELGFEAAEYLEKVPTLLKLLRRSRCLVANNQPLSLWCANAAAKEGLCAGRDYALASCEEMIDCQSVWPWLSRVAFDRVELGRQAGSMMLELLAGARRRPSIELTGSWIPGETARFLK